MVKFILIGGTIVGIFVVTLLVATVTNAIRRRPKGPKPAKLHKKKDIKLGDQSEQSDIILDTIEDGVIFIDMQKTIQIFNPGASKITGWPAEEAIGLDYHSVLKLIDDKGADYPDAQNPFSRVFLEQEVIRDHNATLVSRANRRIALHISVSPLINDQKIMTGAVAVFRDVSEERGEERQRAEFISTASHEMRTPVAAIEGYLALAMNDKVAKIDTKARSYLEKAHASTQHLGQLFQDLLTSAKAEDGRLSSHPVVVEVGNFLEKLTDDLRFAAEKKGLSMEFIIGSSGDTIDASSDNSKLVRPLYYAYADPDRLREVITNLFDNAVKYTDMGKISIGLTGDSSVVQFYIKDTGGGIATEDIPHLFQKFYRVDNSSTRTIGGTGLGLFISRKIIELYNGRIWVESEVGKGSTFFVNLPRLDSAKAKQMQAQAVQTPSPLPDITSIA
jgi:two-component system, OmpR family, sensor histidine kinase VicK